MYLNRKTATKKTQAKSSLIGPIQRSTSFSRAVPLSPLLVVGAAFPSSPSGWYLDFLLKTVKVKEELKRLRSKRRRDGGGGRREEEAGGRWRE